MLRVVLAQKVEQLMRLAATRSEVDIGQEDGADLGHGSLLLSAVCAPRKCSTARATRADRGPAPPFPGIPLSRDARAGRAGALAIAAHHHERTTSARNG